VGQKAVERQHEAAEETVSAQRLPVENLWREGGREGGGEGHVVSHHRHGCLVQTINTIHSSSLPPSLPPSLPTSRVRNLTVGSRRKMKISPQYGERVRHLI